MVGQNMEEEEFTFTAADVQQGSISHLPGFGNTPFKKAPIVRRRLRKIRRRVIYSLKKPVSVNLRNITYNRIMDRKLKQLKKQTKELKEQGYTDDEINAFLNGDMEEDSSENDNEHDDEHENSDNNYKTTSRQVQARNAPLNKTTVSDNNILSSRLRPRTHRPSYKVKLPTSRFKEPGKRGRPPKRHTLQDPEGKRRPGRPPKIAPRPVGRPPKAASLSIGTAIKRSPGRPRKMPSSTAEPKRPRGRPPKAATLSIGTGIKRSPGRPRKMPSSTAEPKRPRGRPPTKLSASAPILLPRGRGRPRKSVTPQGLAGLFLSAGGPTRRLSKAERIALLTQPLQSFSSLSSLSIPPGPQTHAKRPRGRPRKDPAPEELIPRPSIEIPRRRGHPHMKATNVTRPIQPSANIPKKSRGRPAKKAVPVDQPVQPSTGTPRRGPGRPRKIPTNTAQQQRVPIVIDELTRAQRPNQPTRSADSATEESGREITKHRAGRTSKRTAETSSAVTNAVERPTKRPRGRPPKNSKK